MEPNRADKPLLKEPKEGTFAFSFDVANMAFALLGANSVLNIDVEFPDTVEIQQ